MLSITGIVLTVALTGPALDEQSVTLPTDGPYAAIVARIAEALPDREYAVVGRQLRFWRPSGEGPEVWKVEFEEGHRADVLSALDESLTVLGVCEPPERARTCDEFGAATTLALSLPRLVGENVWQVSVLIRYSGARGFGAQYIYTLAEEGGLWRITRMEAITIT